MIEERFSLVVRSSVPHRHCSGSEMDHHQAKDPGNILQQETVASGSSHVAAAAVADWTSCEPLLLQPKTVLEAATSDLVALHLVPLFPA